LAGFGSFGGATDVEPLRLGTRSSGSAVVVGAVSVVVVVEVVVVGVVSVVVVVSAVVVHADGSGEHEPSAATPAAATTTAVREQAISRAGRDALGTTWNINDTVRRCDARS
jgi:hypothetical protein